MTLTLSNMSMAFPSYLSKPSPFMLPASFWNCFSASGFILSSFLGSCYLC